MNHRGQYKMMCRVGVVLCVVSLLGCGGVKGGEERLTERETKVVAPVGIEQLDASRGEELAAMGEAICPGKVGRGEGGEVRCEICPAGTETEGEGEQSLAVGFVGDLRGDGTRVALVDGDGCASHAGGYGGTYLLEQDGAGWRRAAYLGAQRVLGCDPVRFRGSASLLCSQADMHMGLQYESVDILQVRGQDVELMSVMGFECNVGGCPTARESCWEGEETTIKDVDGDGQDDVVWVGRVTTSSLKGGIDESVLEECPDREAVPYDVEVVSLAVARTVVGGKMVDVPAASIKDAKLRALVEARAKVPAR